MYIHNKYDIYYFDPENILLLTKTLSVQIGDLKQKKLFTSI